MNYARFVHFVGLALCALALGCSESRVTPIDDGGVPADAIVLDAWPTVDAVFWGDASEPDGGGDAGVPADDAGAIETCATPGTFETVGCGSCGMVDRFCTSAFVWEYGVCEVPTDAECTPGVTGTAACGAMCGTQTARCDTSCHWIGSGACSGEGACAPGTPERTTSGCTGGNTRSRTCGASCAWGPYSACTTMPTDFDGDGAAYAVDCDDTLPAIYPGSTRGCGLFDCGGGRPLPGLQTCDGPGWGDCVRPCPEPVPCVDGSTERRGCPTSGCDALRASTRVCSAGVWDAWTACAPLMTRPASCDPMPASACGTCGEGLTYSICDGNCAPQTSACIGRGCEPGTRTRDVTSCPAGQYRDTLCSATCLPSTPGPCTAFPPEVDVLLVIDVTGSHTSVVTANATVLATELAGAVLADADVRVGVARFADFAENPYGSPGDVPFAGVLAPSASSAMVTSALTALPGMSGGDGPESGMEALWVIAGGTPNPQSLPFTCAAGLVAGGCWRPAAQRAVIVITDISQHNAPHPALAGGALVEPYTGVTPAPPVWTAVRDRMISERIALFAIIPSATGWGVESYEVGPQMELLVSEVGQDPSQSIAVYPAGTTDWTVVSRQMATMLARYLGLTP